MEASSPMVWGVFGQDCYGLPEEVKQGLLLKTFEEYDEALKYCTDEKFVIHLTRRRKNHVE